MTPTLTPTRSVSASTASSLNGSAQFADDNATSLQSSNFSYALNSNDTINATHYPTCQPTNITYYPTSIPSMVVNSTSYPTSAMHALYDIAHPTEFNFIAISLGISFLFIIVAVTAYGFIQRYTIVRRTISEKDRLYHTRITTPERLEQYFTEDLGEEEELNSFTKNVYAVPMAHSVVTKSLSSADSVRPSKSKSMKLMKSPGSSASLKSAKISKSKKGSHDVRVYIQLSTNAVCTSPEKIN